MQGVFELHLTIPLDGQGHVSCERAAVHGAPGNVRTPPHTHTQGRVFMVVYMGSLISYFLFLLFFYVFSDSPRCLMLALSQR